MPEENKIKKEDPKVDIDTSGPEVDVTLPEEKKEEPVQAEETIKEVVKEEVKERTYRIYRTYRKSERGGYST